MGDVGYLDICTEHARAHFINFRPRNSSSGMQIRDKARSVRLLAEREFMCTS